MTDIVGIHRISLADVQTNSMRLAFPSGDREMERSGLPYEQRQIWDRGLHPSGAFIKIEREELDQAANRLAQKILEQPGAVEEPVDLLFEQGIEAITGILDFQKARRIFVPLDPLYPRSRYMARKQI